MVALSLAFFAGTLSAFAWQHNPARWLTVCIAGFGLTCFLLRYQMQGRCAGPASRRAMLLAGLTAAACAGCAYELACIHAALARRWPPEHADERVFVRARLDGLSARGSAGVSFDAWISPVHEPHAWRRHARILWRDAPPLHPCAGQTWELLVVLRPPAARINPASADGERQLFREGIDALGMVVASSRLNKQIDARRYSLDALRERIARHIRRVVADRDAGALLAALAVGATGEMSAAQWRIFSATGTTHLVAISGSHVTMFAVAAMAVARRLWRVLLCGRVPVPRETFAACLGIAATLAYACLAGLSVPTLRTLLMLGAWQLSNACARASGTLPPLCAALCLIVLIEPFAALGSGFWLSFGAIAAIAAVSDTGIALRAKFHEAAHTQGALFFALAPLTLGWFGSLSLAGLIVNAFAIPAIGWVLVPLVLISLPLALVSAQLCDACLRLGGKLCELVWPWLQAVGESAFAQLHAQPPWWWPALALICLVIILPPWPAALRSAVLAGVSVLAFAVPSGDGAWARITVLDVGAATATIVRTRAHVLLYGVGDAYAADGALVDRVLLPALRAEGIRAVDRVVLGRSSVHGSPGLTALLATFPVAHTSMPRGPPLDFAGAERCSDGRGWSWDGIVFETAVAGSGCIVRISAGAGSALLASEGDPQAGAAGANIVVARAASGAPEAQMTVLSGRHPVDRASWLSTARSGAVQFTLDAQRGLSPPIEWRRLRSGPWRITPEVAPFGL